MGGGDLMKFLLTAVLFGALCAALFALGTWLAFCDRLGRLGAWVRDFPLNVFLALAWIAVLPVRALRYVMALARDGIEW